MPSPDALTIDDVRTIALALPEAIETTSYGHVAFRCGTNFAWERPFSKADRARDGEPPPGTLLAIRVADDDAKREALLAEPDLLLTIRHLDGHPIVLVRLAVVAHDRLRELVTDAYLAVAPDHLRERVLSAR